jgi:SAM-dependent methyltransferase
MILLATLIFFLALGASIFALFCIFTVLALFRGAPFVPMHGNNVRAMVALAGLKPDERLFDLGSGDGRILIAAAARGARAEGWEINPVLVLASRLRIARAGLGNRARVHWGNLWRAPVGEADVVTLFFVHPYMARMEQFLRAKLRPGARVVSYGFRFPNWQPVRSEHGSHLYVNSK